MSGAPNSPDDVVEELSASEFEESPPTAIGYLPRPHEMGGAPPSPPAAPAPVETQAATPAETSEEVQELDASEFDEAPPTGMAPMPVVPPPTPAPPVPPPSPLRRPPPPRMATMLGMPAPPLPPTPPSSPTRVETTHEPAPPQIVPASYPPPDRGLVDAAIARAKHPDFTAEIALYEQELVAAGTDKVKIAELAYEIGELYERRLKDESKAVRSYARSLQSDPTLRPTLLAIRRIFYRRSLWPNLMKLIDAELRFASTDAERANLWVEKGRINEDKLANTPEARECYARAVEAVPTHMGALLALERHVLRAKDDVAWSPLLRSLANATNDPQRKVAFLLDLSRADERRGEAEGARQALTEAYAVGVERRRVLAEQGRLADAQGRPQDLLAALELEAGALEESLASAMMGKEGLKRQIAAIRRRQGQTARHLGNMAGARTYLERALALLPDDALTLADLLDVIEEESSAAISPQRALLIEKLEAASESPAERLALKVRRAAALKAAGRGPDAAALLDTVWSEAPGYLPALTARERTAITGDQHDELTRLTLAAANAALEGNVFGPGVKQPPDAEWAAASYVAAGDLLATRLGRPDEAAAVYAQALHAVERYRPAVEALLALHETTGRHDEVARLLEGISESARHRLGQPGGESALAEANDADEQLFRLYRIELGRPDAAIAAIRRLVERNPDSARLRAWYDEVLAGAGQHAERQANLEQLITRAQTPEAAREVKLELARVCEETAQDARAIAIYKDVLAEVPQHVFAGAALAAVAERAAEHGVLAETLEGERRESLDGGHAARVGLELADVYLRDLGRPQDAATVLADVLDREPDRREARLALARAYLAAGDATRAAEVLEGGLEAPEGEMPEAARARGQGLQRLGELYEALGSDDAAKDAYARARVAGAGTHALLGLTAVAARQNDPVVLRELYGALAAAESEPVARAALLEEVAWLTVGSEDADADAGALRFGEVLALAGDRPGAQLGSALTAARRGDREQLIGALALQAATLTDQPLAAELSLRAAALAEVGHEARAAGLRREALTRAPDSAAAVWLTLECTPPGATAAGELELHEKRRLLGGDGDRAALTLAYAEALADAGRPHAAARSLGGLLKQTPDDPVALDALRRVCFRARNAEGVYRATAHLARVTTDGPRAATLFLEAATLCDRALGRPEEAAPLYRQALGKDPGDEAAYARLWEILAAAGARSSLIELASHMIASAPEPRAPGYLLARAELYEARGTREDATRDYETLLSMDPLHEEALARLAELRELADPEGAADLLAKLSEVTRDPKRLVSALEHLSALRLERLGDKRGAAEALKRLVQADPTRVAQNERLVALYLELGENAEAADACSALAEHRSDPGARAQDELRAAEIMRDRCHDDAGARRALERAQKADPLSWPVIEALAALHQKRSDDKSRTEVLAKALKELRAAITKTPTDARLHSTLAHVFKLAGDDGGRAAAADTLVALAAASPEQRRLHEQGLSARLARAPKASAPLTTEALRARLSHPDARLFLELWGVVNAAAAEIAGLKPETVGMGRAEHVARKQIAAQHPTLDAIAHTLGAAEYELYVGGAKKDLVAVFGVPDTGALCVGSGAASGGSPRARFELGRCLVLIREKLSALEAISEDDAVATLEAALRIATGQTGAAPAPVAEREKQLGKVLGRKDKKALVGLASALPEQGSFRGKALHFREAALSTADRAGLLVSGDVASAIEALGGKDSARAQDLIRWAVSEDHLRLRKELGL